MGTLFLIVCYFRLCLCHFTAIRHLGFEMAIWYWHFVDVVWILVFISIYWWGNSSVNFDNIYNTFEKVVEASTFVDYSDTSLIVTNVENSIQRMQSINEEETNGLIENIVNSYYTGSCKLIINGHFINVPDVITDIPTALINNKLSTIPAKELVFFDLYNYGCIENLSIDLNQFFHKIDLNEFCEKFNKIDLNQFMKVLSKIDLNGVFNKFYISQIGFGK